MFKECIYQFQHDDVIFVLFSIKIWDLHDLQNMNHKFPFTQCPHNVLAMCSVMAKQVNSLPMEDITY